MVLRIVALLFVFSVILDSFTFSFLNESDNLAQLLGIVLAGLFVVFRASQLNFRNVDLRWFLAFFVITALEEGIRYATLEPGVAAFSLRNYSSYVQVFILYLIIRDLSKDPRVFRGLIAVFFLTYFGGALLTDIGVQIATEEGGGGRVGLVGVNVNSFSFALAVIVVGVVSWALSRWPHLGWKGWAVVTSLVVLVPAIAMTGSRGGAGALVLGLVLAIAANLRAKRVPVFFFLVPLILGGVLLVLMRTGVVRQRVQATLNEQDYGIRDVLARGSLVLVRRHPWIGVGPGYMVDLGRLIGTGNIAAHNTYLQVLLSFGFFGIVPFLSGVLLTVLGTWRARGSPWGSFWFAITTMTCAFGVLGHLAYDKNFWIILAVGANARFMAILPPRRQGLIRCAGHGGESAVHGGPLQGRVSGFRGGLKGGSDGCL